MKFGMRHMMSKLEQAQANNDFLLLTLLDQKAHVYEFGEMFEEFKHPFFIGDCHAAIISSKTKRTPNIRAADMERMNLHALRYKLIVVELEDAKEVYDLATANTLELITWIRFNQPKIKLFDIEQQMESFKSERYKTIAPQLKF